MLLATAMSPWRTPYLRAIPPRVSPIRTTCFCPSTGFSPPLAVGVAPAAPAGAERGAEAADVGGALAGRPLVGMTSLWPTWSVAFEPSLLAAARSVREIWFALAMLQRLSPRA